MPRRVRNRSALLFLFIAGIAHAEVFRYGRFEQSFTAAAEYSDPLNDVQVTVAFDGPGNVKDEVRAFWDGGKNWKVRYSPQQSGTFHYRVRSTDKALNGKSGEFQAQVYRGKNPLYSAGPPRLSYDRHYLVQGNNKPWFFLSDTAWNGALLSTPDEWQRYLADRAGKDFTAVQFVMTQWRAGRQDEKGQVAFTGSNPVKINPQFFQRMDEKLNAVNDAGLVAVPVMLWALASKDKESPGVGLTTEDATRLAQYMAVRYAAHQIIWMLGGDGDYAGPNEAKWKSIGEAVFPTGRKRQLVGIHPRGMRSPWKDYKDEGWLDIFFYQSGHGDNAAKWQWNATQGPAVDWKLRPAHPVIDAEPNYEGHTSYQSKKTITDVQVRRAAYYSLLAGPPAGVSYGAHGIWFWSRKAEVPLDHPNTGVAKPWFECLNYPGAQQMKVLRQIFESVDWWRLRPERYLIRDDKFDEGSYRDYIMSALTEKGDQGMMYFPANPEVKLNLSRFESPGKVVGTWADPRTGKKTPAGTWSVDEQPVVKTPTAEDWVLLLQSKK